MIKKSLIESEKWSKKGQKGITLIALIITIIVLLILSTVTIYNLTNKDSSMLTSVETQREDMLKMEAKQAIEVAAEKVKLEHATNKNLTLQDFTDELEKELKNNDSKSDIDVYFDENSDSMYKVNYNNYSFSYYYDIEINKLIKITYTPSDVQYTQSGKAEITSTINDADIEYYYFEGIKPEEITASKLATIKWNKYSNKLNITNKGTLYARLNINDTVSDYIYKEINNIDNLAPIIENVKVNNKIYGELTFTSDIFDATETNKSLSSGIETVNVYLDEKIIKTFDKPTNKNIEYTQKDLVPATVHKYYTEAIDKVGNKTKTAEQQVTVLGQFDLQIKYYLENIDNNNYTLVNTKNHLIEYEKQLNLVDYAIDIENGTYSYASLTASELGAESSKIETTKMGAGMTVAMYYSRNTYTLALEKGKYIESVTGANTYKVGKSVEISAELQKSATGYTNKWDKWTSSNSELLEAPTTQTATIKIPAGNITLTANGTTQANKYTVTFDANTGNTTTKTKEVTFDSTYGELPTPTKTGYTFAGWYTALTGGTKIESTTKVTTASDHTLYARWTPNKYTVTFNANNGSVTPTSKEVTYDSTYGELPTPTRRGHTFKGWYTAVTEGTKIESTTKVTTASSHTLYARWEVHQITAELQETSFVYDGSGKEAKVIVKDGTTILTKDTDYTLTYTNNINVGTATVTIKGKGDYQETTTISKNFEITKRTLTVTATAASKTYGEANPTFAYTYSNNVSGQTPAFSGALECEATATSKVGKYDITIGSLALKDNKEFLKNNYTISYVKANLTINAKNASTFTVTLDSTSYTYDGTAKTPSVAVKDGTTTLTKDTHYTVAYSNNINAGTATVTITGKGNYTGTKTINYTINKRTLTLTATATSKTYGEANPTFAYTYSGQVSGQTPAFSGALACTATATSGVGTYEITQGTLALKDNSPFLANNYSISYVKANLTITAKNASTFTVTIDTTSYTYDGTAKTPTVTVKDGTTILTKDTHYTVGYSNNVNAGTATVTITGKGNYTGTKTINYTINKRTLTLTATATSKTYGEANPTFAYTYSNNVSGQTPAFSGTLACIATATSGVGTYEITQGTLALKDNSPFLANNYSISYVKANLTINAKNASTFTVTLDTTSYTYDGTAKTPTVTVKDGTTTLTKDTNYTVGYSNNVNAGTATVTITGKGNYTGTKTINYTINKRTLTLTATATSKTYGEANPTFAYTYSNNVSGQTPAFSGALACTATATSGVGTYEITQGTLALKDNSPFLANNYSISYVKANLTINAKNASTFTVTLDTTSYTYDGTAKTPTVTVKDGTTILTKDTHYTVGYSNNVNAGTATVTVTGKGNYTGTKTATFTINKANATNPTLTNVTKQYDGTAYPITVSGGSGGTTYYRTSDNNSTWGSWSTTKPTRTNVGTTYVQAYVKGDSNHNDTSATSSATITINKNVLTIKHYLENANDTNYTLYTTTTNETLKNGQTITLADYKTTVENGTYSFASLTESTSGGTAATTTTMSATKTIALYYKRNTATVTLNKDSNISSVTGAGTYKVGSSVSVSAKLSSATGYTISFKNWTGTSTSSSNPYTFTMPASNVTLTANSTKTANSYTVTYDYVTNGGSSATKTSATVKYNAGIDLTPTASKANYTFVGWNTNKDATTALSSLTMGANNVTLYAIYKKNVTITYEKNNGAEDIVQTYAMYNKVTSLNITYPTTATTYNGWTFLSFGDNASATTGYAKGATRTITVAESTTSVKYYHNWKKDVTVTFDKNGGVEDTTANGTIYNGATTITVTTPLATTFFGWRFNGYATTISLTNEGVAAGSSMTLTVASESTTVTAYHTWKTTLTIYHNLENINDNNNSLYKQTSETLVYEGETINLKSSDYELKIDQASSSASMSFLKEDGYYMSINYRRYRYNLNLLKDNNGYITEVSGNGSYKAGQSVTISAIIQDEIGYTYTFTGFTSNNTSLFANITSGWTSDGTTKTITITMPAGAVTLTANATRSANIYGITLNNQSATTAGSTAVYEKYATGIYKESGCTTKMSTTENPIIVPTKQGYIFGGYYTETNGSGTQMINASGYITSNFTTTSYSSAGTLYAKWTIKTLQFTGNGYDAYSVEVGKVSKAPYGASLTIKVPEGGYTVNGEINGGSISINGTAIITGAANSFTGYNITQSGNIILSGTALVEITVTSTGEKVPLEFIGYRVNFDMNGGQWRGAPYGRNFIISIDGGSINTLQEGTSGAYYEGYTLKGWSESSTATTATYAAGATITPTKDMTLYAVWEEEKTHTITYNANGGTGAPASQIKNRNASITLSSTMPKRSGYLFNGWGTSSSATSYAYLPGSTYSDNANLNLYAIWFSPNQTLKFSNGYKIEANTGSVHGSGVLGGSDSAYTEIYLPANVIITVQVNCYYGVGSTGWSVSTGELKFNGETVYSSHNKETTTYTTKTPGILKMQVNASASTTESTATSSQGSMTVTSIKTTDGVNINFK